jgi:2-keto-4-pentenoate hydratase/2-oxohepta-3-ene-1,7-dioic acid hydratase in catechol pathway
MRIASARVDGTLRVGVVRGDEVAIVTPPDGRGSPIRRLFQGGADALARAADEADQAFEKGNVLPTSITLRGPAVPDPEKILCVGFNYRPHAEEMAVELPPHPNVFAKFANSLVGNGDDIELPAVSAQIDYEGELAVVIGQPCRAVSARDALHYVGGYTAFNDVSARDLQFRTSQWTLGKAIDTFAPIGPVITLTDEIADPRDLTLTTRVNGEVVQHACTSEMIFDVAEIISCVSRSMTLEAGDVIATGTPEGVGWKRTPPQFLREGDEVEVEISKIGTLRNRVVHP